MIKLIFEAGPLVGNRYRAEVPITLGRDLSNSIVIPDPSVSLVHAEIRPHDGRATVTDLGSTNGTFLNDVRIISAELRDGDALTLGASRMRAEIQQPAPAAAQSTPPDGAGGEALSANIFGSVTYLLRHKIADGGMGAVYEADQFGAEGFIKRVAIKTILPSFAKKSSFVSSFIGEAKLVANLVHPNIVQIHHLGRHEGGYYIAMEYIDGINLADFMRRHRTARRRVDLGVATYLVGRVCLGLEYAHAKADEAGAHLGLVHRDVSPNNIMISREGEVKLTDFGVARAAQFMDEDEGHLVGSVEYMSPEQAACQPVDARSDLFALGLVYYELLTGLRVFRCRHGDIEATVQRVIDCDIPDPARYRGDIPPVAAEILHTALRQSPDARYPSARAMSLALEDALAAFGRGVGAAGLAEYLRALEPS